MVETYGRHHFSGQIRRCAVKLARDGPVALGLLYDLTASRLWRYALTLTRSHQDAEDAVQAAMVRMALKPRALLQAKHPWPYFLQVLRNEALGIIRRKKPVQLLSAFSDGWAGEEPRWDAYELKEEVRKAIGRLPPSQAEVVVLKIWEEMTFAEIATVLGESPNTVASRYRYALEKLTRFLHAFSGELLHD